MRHTPPAFWVANISNRNVSLTDLALTIPAHKTVNLLNQRSYPHLTSQIVHTSAASGSLWLKRSKITICKVPPQFTPTPLPNYDHTTSMPSRRRSALQITEVHYDELDISDETFAAEAADLTDK